MFICSGSAAVFVYEGAGPTAVNDISLGIEQTLASGMEGMFSTRLDGRKCINVSHIYSQFLAVTLILVLPRHKHTYASLYVWHPDTYVCGHDVYAVRQKSCRVSNTGPLVVYNCLPPSALHVLSVCMVRHP